MSLWKRGEVEDFHRIRSKLIIDEKNNKQKKRWYMHESRGWREKNYMKRTHIWSQLVSFTH